jgi:hypothetical protein
LKFESVYFIKEIRVVERAAMTDLTPEATIETYKLRIPERCLPVYRACFQRFQWQTLTQGMVEALQAISDTKAEADQCLIWEALNHFPENVKFPGQILDFLTGITPYPMPVHPGAQPRVKMEGTPLFETDLNIHPGPLTNFNVYLPDSMKRHELHTDWYEVSHFQNHRPPPDFSKMLDQLEVGSALNPGTAGHFYPPFGLTPLPWRRLSNLATFPCELAIQILKDWAIILRRHGGLLGPLPDQRKGGVERVVIKFLVQRYGYDRLQA